MSNIPSTSKQIIVQDDDIFEDSAILANFDNSSFRETSTRLSDSNINDSANRSALNVSALCCDEEISGYDKLSGRTWIYPTNYSVRDYQFNIIQAALSKNTLVSLPTGLGKTFIAAVIMYNFYRWYPLGKIVFTAPTRPLVAQQINACYNIVAIPPEDTVEMTGQMAPDTRRKHWQSKRVFFATPQVIHNDIKAGLCPGEKLRCLVIDEAHKAKGNFAYVQIVGALADRGHRTYRILALSATPGSRVEDVISVVQNLHIAHLELRTESCIDVAKYSHARNINTVVVPLGPELTHLRQQYVEIMDDYARRLKQLNVLPQNLGNMSKGRVLMLYKEYQAKDRSARHPQHQYMMKDFTVLISLFHGLELLNKHGARVFLNFFDQHPEKNANDRLTALLERLRDDLGVDPLTLNTSVLPDGTIPEIPKDLCFGHPKFDKLKQIIIGHFHEAKEKNEDTRAIVFCEYRESVKLVHCMLLQCRPLIQPHVFVGQGASGKDGKPAVSQKQQLSVMRNFRDGVYNTLVATCVAEEGLDVGSVDLIICFDISTRSPIRLVQRCGRTGRERAGQVHILVTEGREHQTLLDCMRQRDGLNQKILKSRDVQAALYQANPRMMPRDFMPQCQKMHMTVEKKNEGQDGKGKNKKNQKNLRTMLLARGSSSSSASSNRDVEVSIISEQEFKEIFPNGIPYAAPSRTPMELWTKSKETIKQLITSEDQDIAKLTELSTWLEWQRTLQNTVNVAHSRDTEILASLLQYSDAKRFDLPPSTQNPTFATQNFATQKIIPSSPAKVASPSKVSPVKRQTKKKQKPLLIKSPGKRDGDIRALFSTATKSTKNYTKLINDLGIQNDGSIPTRLINLLVDLSLENTNSVKKCYICENVCECALLQDLRKDRKRPTVLLSFIDDIKLPDIDLLDEIDADTILNFAKTDESRMFVDSNIDDVNTSYLGVENMKPNTNFELEFDFGSPVDLISPEMNIEENKRTPVKGEVNFDIGDIEDVFADSSPEEVNEIAEAKSGAGHNHALDYFGLDSIDDIFADSDDDSDHTCPKITQLQTPTKSDQKELSKQDNKENLEIGTENKMQVPIHQEIRPPSPSILTGKLKTSTSPILCSQVRKFKLSTKKKQPQSSTPQNSNDSVRRQLIPDFSNNNISTTEKDATKSSTTHNSLADTTNKSMLTITQLVDLINKTDPKVAKDVSNFESDGSTSPILLTQAERTRAVNDKKINKKLPTQQSQSVPKQNHSLIILESDDSGSDNDNTQLYDLNDKNGISFNSVLSDTPKKTNDGIVKSEPIILNPSESACTNKRKLEDEEIMTDSPYFNKKQRLEAETKNTSTLKQKIQAALSKKNSVNFNNDTNVHFVMSPTKTFSQKENKDPYTLQQEKDLKVNDDEEYIRKRNLEMLQMFRRDSKVLSSKNLSSVLNSPTVKVTQKRKLAFDDSDEDFLETDSRRNKKKTNDDCKKTTKNHKVRKKKPKPNVYLDLEAAVSDDGLESGDELSDDSAGSIAEFICDETLTQREDMRAVYMRSVKSPVKGTFKIPDLPKKYNKEEIFSQFVEEDSYEMDSFCVDSHIGLTQINDCTEDLELAEMLLKERKRNKPKKAKTASNLVESDDSPVHGPVVRRRKKIVNAIHSDSEDSS